MLAIPPGNAPCLEQCSISEKSGHVQASLARCGAENEQSPGDCVRAELESALACLPDRDCDCDCDCDFMGNPPAQAQAPPREPSRS